jgi:hypothetical protein
MYAEKIKRYFYIKIFIILNSVHQESSLATDTKFFTKAGTLSLITVF